MRRVTWLLILSCFPAASALAQGRSIDWPAQRPELLRHFRALLQIDSRNPPGNETQVVDYLKSVLDAEGITTRVFALEPARANLVARIRGNGSKRPVLIMAHTDVVGVQRDKWAVDPFGAVLRDGYVWGRGAVDDKDNLATNLMLMLLLARSHTALDRDVIFLAEAGEEGTTAPGIEFMVNRHFDAIDAEYVLAEGGGGERDQDGQVTKIAVSTTEKLPRRARLVVNGPSGHGSVPRIDNALVHLAAAVAKLGAWQTPMRLNETTRAYFERLAAVSPPEQAVRYTGLTDPERSAVVQRYFAEHEPPHYSMLRTSVVPTIVSGGFRANVIPSEAEATIDIRMAPGEDVEAFFEQMQTLIADPSVRIERLTEGLRPPTAPSGLDNEMFRALETVAQRLYTGSTTLPTMLNGATDMAFLRARGIQSYGIGPATTVDDRTNYGAHSDVERLPETSLYDFMRFTWEVVMAVAATR